MLLEFILAWCIAKEAIGEPLYGKRMVASVIVVRSVERKLTPVQVVKQRKQFSCFNNHPSEARMMKDVAKWRRTSMDEWSDCMLLAVQIQNQMFVPVWDCNHYHNPELCNPKHATKYKNVKVVGHHVFGRIDR